MKGDDYVICEICGSNWSDNTIFCRNCGNDLNNLVQSEREQNDIQASSPDIEATVENQLLPDCDFIGWEEACLQEEIQNNNVIPEVMEQIIVEPEGDLLLENIPSKVSMPSLGNAAIAYLKRNWIFITTMLFLWMMLGVTNYSFRLYTMPVIGQVLILLQNSFLTKPLIFLTATYNGPMGFGQFGGGLSFYSLLSAITGKSIYLLAMTGVIFPSIREFIKGDTNKITPYKNAFDKSKNIIKDIFGSKASMGIFITAIGAALIFSNIITRNGKIDKAFVLILLCFTLFKGFGGALPSGLDYLIRKFISLLAAFMPGNIKNANKRYEVLRLGALMGFALAVLVGNFGEYADFIIGIVLLIAGAFLYFTQKEKA